MWLLEYTPWNSFTGTPLSIFLMLLHPQHGRPGEVTVDGDAQVLAGTCCFQCLPIEEVAWCQGLYLLVWHDADDITFAWVEFHLPVCSHSSRESRSFWRRAWSFWSLILLYRRLSSAKSLALECWTSGRLLIYVKKRGGPRTVPWGTPNRTAAEDHSVPSSATCHFPLVRKDCILFRVLLPTP